MPAPARRVAVLSAHLPPPERSGAAGAAAAGAPAALRVFGSETGDQVGLAPGAPNASPFVCKVLMLCRMAGVPYELVCISGKQQTTPPKGIAPKGKVPWIEHDGAVVADSHFILRYLREKFASVRALDAHLSPADRAVGLALSRQFDEWVFWGACVWPRFGTEAGIEAFLDLYYPTKDPTARPRPEATARFGRAPRAQAKKLLFGPGSFFVGKMEQHGIGLHSDAEITSLVREDIERLDDFLAGKRYLFGDRPSSYDAALWGHVKIMLSQPIPHPLTDAARSLPNVAAWAARLGDAYFPAR